MTGDAGANVDSLRDYVSEANRGDAKPRLLYVNALGDYFQGLDSALNNVNTSAEQGERPTIPFHLESKLERALQRLIDLDDFVEEVADGIEAVDGATPNANGVTTVPETNLDVDRFLTIEPGEEARPMSEGDGAWTVAELALENELDREPTNNEVWLYWNELREINGLEIDAIIHTDTVLEMPELRYVDGLEHLAPPNVGDHQQDRDPDAVADPRYDYDQQPTGNEQPAYDGWPHNSEDDSASIEEGGPVSSDDGGYGDRSQYDGDNESGITTIDANELDPNFSVDRGEDYSSATTDGEEQALSPEGEDLRDLVIPQTTDDEEIDPLTPLDNVPSSELYPDLVPPTNERPNHPR